MNTRCAPAPPRKSLLLYPAPARQTGVPAAALPIAPCLQRTSASHACSFCLVAQRAREAFLLLPGLVPLRAALNLLRSYAAVACVCSAAGRRARFCPCVQRLLRLAANLMVCPGRAAAAQDTYPDDDAEARGPPRLWHVS